MDARRTWLVKRVVLAAVALALMAAVGWPFWFAREQWDRLDNAAEDFRVPRGFTEVARPRQGSGFCWVTCTGGGEAVVTIVLESDYDDPDDACRALRTSVVALAGTASDSSYLEYCGWEGPLDGSATVFAGAGEQASFLPHDGHRWTEVVPTPDSPVVAYIEFNSGLE